LEKSSPLSALADSKNNIKTIIREVNEYIVFVVCDRLELEMKVIGLRVACLCSRNNGSQSLGQLMFKRPPYLRILTVTQSSGSPISKKRVLFA
jgi:hypothetical protein